MKNKLGNITKWSAFPSLILMLAFFILNIFMTDNFLSMNFMTGFFAANTPLICVSIGVGVVMRAGGIDISLGGMVCLVNVCFAMMIEAGVNSGVAVLVCILLAVGMGALNGLIVGFLRVSPMLATFAASSIYAGLALWLMPLPGGSIPSSFTTVYNNAFLGIPFPVFIIALVLVLAKLIQYSRFGTNIMASGQNEQKAYVSGIHVDRVRFFTYVFAGLCAGIAGLAISSNSGGGDSRVGLTLSLNSLAACVIGGISLAGGKGDAWGAVFGALFLQMVTTVVLATGVSSFYQDFIKGIILLLGTLGSIILSTRTEKSLMKAPQRLELNKEEGQ
ncbi:MAG: ABC transporter permease [Christensenella sp.]|nr:ABC transporter permease [Christensenella sp.]